MFVFFFKMWVSQFLSNRVSDIVTNGAFFRLSLNSLNMQENSFQKNLPNSSLYRNLKHPLLQEEEDILEIKIEAALLQPGSGLEMMLKMCSCRNSIIQKEWLIRQRIPSTWPIKEGASESWLQVTSDVTVSSILKQKNCSGFEWSSLTYVQLSLVLKQE